MAGSSSHAKLPYSEAVFQALKDTTSAPLIMQFRKYLPALLGYKHQERVLDVMSKVDKSVRSSAPSLPRSSQSRLKRRFQFRLVLLLWKTGPHTVELFPAPFRSTALTQVLQNDSSQSNLYTSSIRGNLRFSPRKRITRSCLEAVCLFIYYQQFCLLLILSHILFL